MGKQQKNMDFKRYIVGLGILLWGDILHGSYTQREVYFRCASRIGPHRIPAGTGGYISKAIGKDGSITYAARLNFPAGERPRILRVTVVNKATAPDLFDIDRPLEGDVKDIYTRLDALYNT